MNIVNKHRHWLSTERTYDEMLAQYPTPPSDMDGCLILEGTAFDCGILNYALAEDGEWVSVTILVLAVELGDYTPTIVLGFGE